MTSIVCDGGPTINQHTVTTSRCRGGVYFKTTRWKMTKSHQWLDTTSHIWHQCETLILILSNRLVRGCKVAIYDKGPTPNILITTVSLGPKVSDWLSPDIGFISLQDDCLSWHCPSSVTRAEVTTQPSVATPASPLTFTQPTIQYVSATLTLHLEFGGMVLNRFSQ